MAILKNPDFFQRNQSLTDHLIDYRQQQVYLVGAVDDLDDDRQVFREPQNLRSVYAAGGPEAHQSPQHRCARDAHLASLENDCFVKRLTVPAVRFADEDAQKLAVFGNLHSASNLNAIVVARFGHLPKPLRAPVKRWPMR